MESRDASVQIVEEPSSSSPTIVITAEPSIVIVEQPAKLSTRFRYKSENRAVPLLGEESTKEKKSYPAIKVVNYTGTVFVIVSCVTSSSEPYRPHPHELTGVGCDNGIFQNIFTTDSNNPSIIEFHKLCLRRSKRSEIAERLQTRRSSNINPFRTRHNAEEDMQIDLHSIRLCFQVVLRPNPNNRNYDRMLAAKVSQRIVNKMSTEELKIVDISDTCSPQFGGKKIMIFCSSVSENNINVRFIFKDEKNEILVDCDKIRLHRNFGIEFKTPKYPLQSTQTPWKVFIELFRPSDNVRSQPWDFVYVPDVNNVEVLMRSKRPKIEESKLFCEYLCRACHQLCRTCHQLCRSCYQQPAVQQQQQQAHDSFRNQTEHQPSQEIPTTSKQLQRMSTSTIHSPQDIPTSSKQPPPPRMSISTIYSPQDIQSFNRQSPLCSPSPNNQPQEGTQQFYYQQLQGIPSFNNEPTLATPINQSPEEIQQLYYEQKGILTPINQLQRGSLHADFNNQPSQGILTSTIHSPQDNQPFNSQSPLGTPFFNNQPPEGIQQFFYQQDSLHVPANNQPLQGRQEFFHQQLQGIPPPINQAQGSVSLNNQPSSSQNIFDLPHDVPIDEHNILTSYDFL